MWRGPPLVEVVVKLGSLLAKHHIGGEDVFLLPDRLQVVLPTVVLCCLYVLYFSVSVLICFSLHDQCCELCL